MILNTITVFRSAKHSQSNKYFFFVLNTHKINLTARSFIFKLYLF